MANYQIKIDLLKLKGAFVKNIQGKSEAKRCVIIPIEDAGVFEGQKGCYLNTLAWETNGVMYGQTHIIKPSLSKEQLQTLSEEERKHLPIIGGLIPLQAKSATQPQIKEADKEEIWNMLNNADRQDNDLPF